MTNPDRESSRWRDRLPGVLRAAHGLLQNHLLNSSRFATLAGRRGLGTYGRDTIRTLWNLGLLRADRVTSSSALDRSGLQTINDDHEERREYLDVRVLETRPEGWFDAAKTAPVIPPDLELYFHPFRLFVLFHIRRSFAVHYSQIQSFVNAAGLQKLVESEASWLRQHSAEGTFAASWNWRNDLAALAVATEPLQYPAVSGVTRGSALAEDKDFWRDMDALRSEVTNCYRVLGIEDLREIHQELCIAAELLDPNKDVHVLLRLSGRNLIDDIEGHLGGAMLVLAMAEVIRRETETVFGASFPEEDERGFGYTPETLKQHLYGTRRLLDGTEREKAELVRRFGLDYGPRLRWYVEGDTECAALQSVFGGRGYVEIVNLRGSVAERGGKGVAFRENLALDVTAGRFSFVSIDGDRSDYVRVVRRAAEADEFTGRMFISRPDFELQNFTHDELEEIIWQAAEESGADATRREDMHARVLAAQSGAEILKVAKAAVPELAQLEKGRDWGLRLIRYAFRKPEVAPGRRRTLVDAIETAMRTHQASFHRHRSEYRVDPSTGDLVRR